MLERLLRRWVPQDRLGFGVVLGIIRMCLLFLMVSLIGYYAIHVDVNSDYQSINNLKSMQTNALMLQKSLIDQETGQRGYGLTGDSEFLEPFQQGSAQFQTISKQLQQQADLYPDLKQPVYDLIASGQKWHDAFGVPLITKVAEGNHDTTDDLKTGKSSFDSFRKNSSAVLQLLKQKQEQQRSHYLVSINVILIVLSIATIVIGAVIISMILRRFQKLTEPINSLSQAVHAYAERNFDVPVPQTGSVDELSRLLGGIDKMRVELKKRFDAEQRRTQFSQMLVRLQETLFQEVEFADAAERISKELHRLIESDHVAVFEIVDERFRVLGSSGMDDVPNQWFSLSETSMPAMIERRAPVIKTNWTHQTQNAEINTYMNDQLGMQATVNLPLYAENRCFAMIHFSWQQPIEITEEDQHFYEEIIGLLATALWSARLWTLAHELAAKDGLTGIWNRRHFDESLEREIKLAQQHAKPLCLLMLDVDRFKLFNDTYGHVEGDRLLRHVAQLLERSARPQDVAARYGGEEFVVILRDTTSENALEFAEELRAKLKSEPLPPYAVTVSFGLASFQPGDDPQALIERADRMLYQAKENGRDRIEADLQRV